MAQRTLSTSMYLAAYETHGTQFHSLDSHQPSQKPSGKHLTKPLGSVGFCYKILGEIFGLYVKWCYKLPSQQPPGKKQNGMKMVFFEFRNLSGTAACFPHSPTKNQPLFSGGDFAGDTRTAECPQVMQSIIAKLGEVCN